MSRRAADGDTAAFEEVFRRYHQQLFRYCRSIVGDEQDALDALQNTMGKALSKLPGETREIRMKPWLFRVAHNECIDALESRRRTVDVEDTPLDSGVRIESEVADRERLAQVLADIDRLPYSQRSALVMRELNGIGYDDIAEALEISPGGAKQTVFEARIALREMEAGRSMTCERALEAVSTGDGRIMRGRKLRAHLRSCARCRDFRSGIESRQQDLRSLVPFLPAALAASVLGGLGGGGGGGLGGGLLTLFGGGSGAAAGSKVAAVVAVTAGLGAGTVGVVEGLGPGGDGGVKSASQGAAVVGESQGGAGTIRVVDGSVDLAAEDIASGSRRPSRKEKSRSRADSGPPASGRGGVGQQGKNLPGSFPGSPPGLQAKSESGAPGRSGEAPGAVVSAAARGSGRGSGGAPGTASNPPAPVPPPARGGSAAAPSPDRATALSARGQTAQGQPPYSSSPPAHAPGRQERGAPPQ